MKSFNLTAAAVTLAMAGAAVAGPQPSEVIAELASPGTLRVAVAIGNSPSAFRVARDGATGEPRGVPVVLAQDLAKKLGVELQLVSFTTAAALTNAVAAGVWDVAFMPADVGRAQTLDFTAPYYLYETGLLARPGSSLRRVDQADLRGVRIGALAGSTTLLNTSRSMRKATVTPFATRAELIAALRAGKVDVAAMPRGWVQQAAADIPGSRALSGEFHSAGVAAAVPKNRPAMLAFLHDFIEDEKASGVVQKALESEGIRSGIVAPAVAAKSRD